MYTVNENYKVRLIAWKTIRREKFKVYIIAKKLEFSGNEGL